MSALTWICPGDDWALLAAIVLAQVTVIILAAWLLAWACTRWNAAARNGIYRIALICVLAGPALTLIMRSGGVTLVALPAAARRATTETGVGSSSTPAARPAISGVTEAPTTTLVTADFEHPAAKTASHGPRRIPLGDKPSAVSSLDMPRVAGGAALAIWLLGMAWLLVRWWHGLRLIAALRRSARPLDGETIAGPLCRVRRALGSDQLPVIAVSAELDRPVMVGLIRPLVILPENVLETLNERDLTDVLVHECAHAVCRHQAVGFLQRLAGVLFWPHPLVHLLNRELARSNEEVCDNYVLRHGDATCYARTLLTLSRTLNDTYLKPTALGLLFHWPWRLEDRVADLLDERRIAMTRVNRWTAAALTATFVFVTVLIAGTTVVEAEPPGKETPRVGKSEKVQRRAVDKRVADFPEGVDLSAPESAMAAFSRGAARKDFKATRDLSWVKLDAESAKAAKRDLQNNPMLPDDFSRQVLDSHIVAVLTYREDLAAVIFTSSLLGKRTYAAQHFGRIDGKWMNLDWNEYARDLARNVEEAERSFERNKEELWRKFAKVRDDVKNGRTPVADRGKIRQSPALSEEMKRSRRESWQMSIDLDMPNLDPPVVQFAVFDKDPVPAFRAQVGRMRDYYRTQLGEATDKAVKEGYEMNQMRFSWDSGFREVTGDRLSLLVDRPGPDMWFSTYVYAGEYDGEKSPRPRRLATTVSSKKPPAEKRPDAGVAVVEVIAGGGGTVSANMPKPPPPRYLGGKKWIVTKTVQIEGKPVCWCIPVEVKPGGKDTVTLDASNTFELKAAYDEAMAEKQPAASKE